MRLRRRDPKLGLCSSDVRLLQLELRLLNLNIAEKESSEDHFGEFTREAILRFQEEVQLEQAKIVGLTTARLLNAKIRERVLVGGAIERLAEATQHTLKQVEGLAPTSHHYDYA